MNLKSEPLLEGGDLAPHMVDLEQIRCVAAGQALERCVPVRVRRLDLAERHRIDAPVRVLRKVEGVARPSLPTSLRHQQPLEFL